jgi:outer membrane lipoprotein SlyB
MDNSLRKMHPLMLIAASAVILTCLVALLMMTGILPGPGTREATVVGDTATPEVTTSTRSSLNEQINLRPNQNQNQTRTAAAPAPRERAAPRPATGNTAPRAGGTVAGGEAPAPAPKVAAVCNNCGTVTSVRAVKQQGDAGLLGPIAGGAVGGLVGSQIGGGSGKTIATIVGAAGGAAVGTEVERRHKSTTSYVVGVRLNDGSTRSFTYGSNPGVQSGDRVKVVDGQLVRDS